MNLARRRPRRPLPPSLQKGKQSARMAEKIQRRQRQQRYLFSASSDNDVMSMSWWVLVCAALYVLSGVTQVRTGGQSPFASTSYSPRHHFQKKNCY